MGRCGQVHSLLIEKLKMKIITEISCCSVCARSIANYLLVVYQLWLKIGSGDEIKHY
jgi:hypothetical protein